MRPLQVKRRRQLQQLGFPVLCVDRFSQIKDVIEAVKRWKPGEVFPKGLGAAVPELENVVLPGELADMSDFGDTLETEDPEVLGMFKELDSIGQ